jgi:hypothetical protein
MGRTKVHNDLDWMLASSWTAPTPMDVDLVGADYYGSKPMITETSYQAQITSGRYYGSKPMVTETYSYNTGGY